MISELITAFRLTKSIIIIIIYKGYVIGFTAAAAKGSARSLFLLSINLSAVEARTHVHYDSRGRLTTTHITVEFFVQSDQKSIFKTMKNFSTG